MVHNAYLEGLEIFCIVKVRIWSFIFTVLLFTLLLLQKLKCCNSFIDVALDPDVLLRALRTRAYSQRSARLSTAHAAASTCLYTSSHVDSDVPGAWSLFDIFASVLDVSELNRLELGQDFITRDILVFTRVRPQPSSTGLLLWFFLAEF